MASKYVKDLEELGAQLRHDGYPVSATTCENSAKRMDDMEKLIVAGVKRPSEYDITNVASRIELHSAMNEQMSWALQLCLLLDIKVAYKRIKTLRSHFAGYIDQRAKEKRDGS